MISWQNMRLSPRPSSFFSHLLLLFSIAAIVMPGSISAETGRASSPLTRLATVLKESPLPMRSDFAWLALTQMAAFYNEEATRARDELRHSSKARDAANWAASVDNYAGKITAVAESISTESSIIIAIGISNDVHVYVDGQPMILSAALSSQQVDYEQRVLERFCTLYRCDELLQDIDYGEPDQNADYLSTDAGNAYWSFSQYAGPVCMTDNGLEFQFQQLSDLAAMRLLCSRIVAELNELTALIVLQQRQGSRIDWGRLTIQSAPAEESTRVILAGRVETSLDLPLLAERSELLRLVRPWLKARVRGESYQLIVLNAERVLGSVLLNDPGRDDPMTGSQRYPAFDAGIQ